MNRTEPRNNPARAGELAAARDNATAELHPEDQENLDRAGADGARHFHAECDAQEKA